jgi:hypothetical protein
MPRSLAALIVSLFAMPMSALAQTHPSFDGRSLSLGLDSMQITLVRDSLKETIGTLSNELSVKGATLTRVYRSNNVLFGTHVDTLVSDWPTLRARSQRTTSTAVSVAADYAGGKVTGWRRQLPGDTVAIANLQNAPPYDAAMFDVLVRATDFTKDSVLTVQAFSAGNDTVLTLSARYAGAERVTLGVSAYDAWKVEMDFAGMSSTMWIEPKSRRLLKQIIRLQPNIHLMMVSF